MGSTKWTYHKEQSFASNYLTGPQLLEEGCWERWGDFFRVGVQFSHNNKLKSEIFNAKRVYKQKHFFLP